MNAIRVLVLFFFFFLPPASNAQHCVHYYDTVLSSCQLCNQYSGVATTWRNFGNYCLSCSFKCQQITPLASGGSNSSQTTCRQNLDQVTEQGLYYEITISDSLVMKLAEENIIAASILAGLKYHGEAAIDPIDRRSGVLYFSHLPTRESVAAILKRNYVLAERSSGSLPVGKKLHGLYRTEFARDGSIAGIIIESTGDAILNDQSVFIPLMPEPVRTISVHHGSATGLILQAAGQ